MTMKVVVYSNFPEALVAKDVTPKLERFGVEVISVINVDKGKVSDFTNADALCAMVEKMSAGQRDKVKSVAKAAGKPFYPLTRSSSDWVKFFGEPGIPVITVPPPSSALVRAVPQSTVLAPTSSRRGFAAVMPPPETIRAAAPPQILATADEVNALGETLIDIRSEMRGQDAELQRLSKILRNAEDENRALRNGNEKTRTERDQMTERCRALNKVIEERNVEIDKLKRTPQPEAFDLIKKNGEIEELRERIAVLEADNASYEQIYERSAAEYTKFKEERDAHKRGHEAAMKEVENLEELKARQATELYRLREENKKLKAALDGPKHGPNPATVVEFFRVRDAFKLLWESKAMKADDVLKQLLEWKGSE